MRTHRKETEYKIIIQSYKIAFPAIKIWFKIICYNSVIANYSHSELYYHSLYYIISLYDNNHSKLFYHSVLCFGTILTVILLSYISFQRELYNEKVSLFLH
jgi:hypothetical protein